MDIPLKRLSLYSSGTGFFEHSGEACSPERIDLAFKAGALNDALKSLAINDPASDFPAVSYSSHDSLEQALKSLNVGLKADEGGGMADILHALRGAEIEAAAPTPVVGRIVDVDVRSGRLRDALLLLLTSGGLKSIPVRDIASFSFTDEKTGAAFNRALDLLRSERDGENVTLSVSLPGTGRRRVSLSYVIPAPVWKASYRLNLGKEQPLLQGWAIVDNGSCTDWKDAQLSLVSGRPVTFIQDLGNPYHAKRHERPLAIAGIAQTMNREAKAAQYLEDFGTVKYPDKRETRRDPWTWEIDCGIKIDVPAPRGNADPPGYGEYEEQADDGQKDAGESVETAQGPDAEYFEYTLKHPVNLESGRSAMFPLVQAPVGAEKFLFITGPFHAPKLHPKTGVELTNTTGMRLPAGSVTVCDGTYAGDALIEFLAENEKRFISYGEDLTVTGSVVRHEEKRFSSGVPAGVNKHEGVVLKKHSIYTDVYTFRNAQAKTKKLILEHWLSADSAYTGPRLIEPLEYREKDSAWSGGGSRDIYCFELELPCGETSFTVRWEALLEDQIFLEKMSVSEMLNCASGGEIPQDVRSVLLEAVEQKKKAGAAAKKLEKLSAKKIKLLEDQDRIRKNLDAAGSESPQGQQYLKRMDGIDRDIDSLDRETGAARKELEEANKALRPRGLKEI